MAPVNDMAQAFDMPQTQAREMRIEMKHDHGPVALAGSPLKLSATPVTYRHAPPPCGRDTLAVLKELGFGDITIRDLKDKGTIA